MGFYSAGKQERKMDVESTDNKANKAKEAKERFLRYNVPAAHAGSVRKSEETRARFLRLYDPALTIRENCETAQIKMRAYFTWMAERPAFAAEIHTRKALLHDAQVTKIENAVVKAATGEIVLKRTVKDKDGAVQEVIKAEQPPSYKHGELFLLTHAADVYKPDIEGGLNISINLLPARVGDEKELVEAGYLDVGDDPVPYTIKQPAGAAKQGGGDCDGQVDLFL